MFFEKVMADAPRWEICLPRVRYCTQLITRRFRAVRTGDGEVGASWLLVHPRAASDRNRALQETLGRPIVACMVLRDWTYGCCKIRYIYMQTSVTT